MSPRQIDLELLLCLGLFQISFVFAPKRLILRFIFRRLLTQISDLSLGPMLGLGIVSESVLALILPD